jgi:hypothetical protein
MPRRNRAKRNVPKATDLARLAEDLPELTSQQQAFVERLLAGDSASDAYRASYNAGGMTPASIWVASSRLARDAKVTLWLQASRIAGLGSASITLGQHLRELERGREIAYAEGIPGAAIQAERYRGEAAGLYVERLEVTDRRSDPLATLRRIAEHSPALAQALADQYGLTLTITATRTDQVTVTAAPQASEQTAQPLTIEGHAEDVTPG